MLLLALAALVASPGCAAVDGDTLSCRSAKRLHRTYIRLNGIDAPEMPGHCAKGRVCVAGDPIASKDNLASLIDGKRVTWRSFGKDKYGRTLANPAAGGVNLSCAQLKGGFAQYWKEWDNKGRTARVCHVSPALSR